MLTPKDQKYRNFQIGKIRHVNHATFFDTHVKVGLVAGLEPVGLARRMPLESVLRMALLGGAERLSAQQALELGMVGEVVPKQDLMARARELAF